MHALRIASLWVATCGNRARIFTGICRGRGFGGVSVHGRGLVDASCQWPRGCSLLSTTKAYSTTLIREATAYVVRSRFELEELPDCNFARKVMENWSSFGNKPAIVEAGTNRMYTYAQLFDAVRRVGSALRKLGFKEKDVLCVSNNNNIEYPIVYYSVQAIRGIANPVNPAYTKTELMQSMALTEASFVFCTPTTVSTVQEAVAGLHDPNQIKKIIVMGDFPSSNGNHRFVPFSTLLEDDGSAFDGQAVSVDSANDIACMPLSSGTTGLPKAVMLTHRNLVASLVQFGREPLFSLKSSDVVSAVLPFYHIYGLSVIMSIGLHSGSLLVTFPRWDPHLYLSTIEKHKVNVMPLVPPLILFMCKDALTSSFDLSSLEHVTSGAAPLGPDLSNEFLKKFPHVKTLCQGYGLTETCPTHMNTRTNWRAGSVGELIPGVEAKIVDVASGHDCPPNTDGELLVRGPNIMKGYLKNVEANCEVFPGDGWMRTGDIAYYDKDGFFYVIDRLKELIKYKGAQVPPAELEAVLLTHPAVRDSAVIGIPDDEAGELPRAFVCLKPGQQATADEIVAYVATRVSPAKRLRGGVVFVTEIPKSASGKILRRVLKTKAPGM